MSHSNLTRWCGKPDPDISVAAESCSGGPEPCSSPAPCGSGRGRGQHWAPDPLQRAPTLAMVQLSNPRDVWMLWVVGNHPPLSQTPGHCSGLHFPAVQRSSPMSFPKDGPDTARGMGIGGCFSSMALLAPSQTLCRGPRGCSLAAWDGQAPACRLRPSPSTASTAPALATVYAYGLMELRWQFMLLPSWRWEAHHDKSFNLL